MRSTPRLPRLADTAARALPLAPSFSSSSAFSFSASSSSSDETSHESSGPFCRRKSTRGTHVNRVQSLSSLPLAIDHSLGRGASRLVPLRRIDDSWPVSSSVRDVESRFSRGIVPPVVRRRCFCHTRLHRTRRNPPHPRSRRRQTAVASRTTRPLPSPPPPPVSVSSSSSSRRRRLVLSLMTPTDDCDDRERDNQHRSLLTVPYHYDSRLVRSSFPT